MRIVATACLVLAILFMVGCGTSAEDKKLIQEHGTKIQNLDKKVGDMEKMAQEMGKKFDGVDAFLKGKFPKEYGVEPKKEEPKPGAPAAKKEEPKKEEPKKPEPKKTPPATKTK